MKKMFWVGDAGCDSGFARVTHGTLEVLRRYWDVTVVGVNYRGDPHSYSYPMYPAFIGGDLFGSKRTAELAKTIKPEFIVVQTDPWNIPIYLNALNEAKVRIPVIGTLAVDGKNCRGDILNELQLAMFWTKFGEREARKGGYQGRSAVVPLGVDLEQYRPFDREAARKELGIFGHCRDAFIVGNVNRNQHRKRLDLTIQYFAEWTKQEKIKDAYLFLHVAPTGDQGFDCKQLAQYYGIDKRLILADPDVWDGPNDDHMTLTYNAFDIQITTTQGEGWGLCTMEGMACGIPQVVPDWSALGEWAGNSVIQVPCTSTAVTPNFINAIGGVPDKIEFIRALDDLYRDPTARELYSKEGLVLVSQPQFRWENIGLAFAKELASLYKIPEEVKETVNA